MSTPAISVVMPVYNGEKYLREAIDSILNQTFSDFEFIILNDGSTDKTEEIILSYTDPRIVYVKNEENLQIVKTLNKGIALAKGKYIARMDADDISMPERFEKQFEFMETHPDVGVCGTWLKTFGDVKAEWTYPVEAEEVLIALMFYSPVAHPTAVIRKVVFDFFKYEQNYNKAEDYKLWVDISKQFTIVNIPCFLLRYRLHSSQTAVIKNDIQLNISNDIRKEVLYDFGLDFNEEELVTHIAISRYKSFDFTKAEKWFIKILAHNDKKQFYEKYALDNFIAKHWFRTVSMNSEKGLEIFFHYLFKSKLPVIKKPVLIMKLFIKCMIKKKARA